MSLVTPDDLSIHVDVHAQILQHLTERGYVPYHGVLADRYGHRAALFIGAGLYWTRRSLKERPGQQGWFYMSTRQMTDATTLTRHEQDTVRALLRDAGVLQERKGQQGVLHYRINLLRLGSALQVIHTPPNEQLDFEQVWMWFQNAVAFYRPLADLTGSASGGIYLSWLLRRHRQAVRARRGTTPEMLHVDPREVAQALRLTPKVLRATRERLRKAGLIAENGVWTRLNIDAILALIQQQSIKRLPVKDKPKDEPKTPENCAAVHAARAEVKDVPTRKPAALIAPRQVVPANRNLLVQRALPLEPTTAPVSSQPRPGASAWGMIHWVVAGNPQLQAGQATNASRTQAVDRIAQSGKLPSAQSGKLVDNWLRADAQSGKLDAQSGKLDARSGKLDARSGKLTLPNPATHINNNTNNKQSTTNARVSRPPVDNFAAEAQACRRRSADAPKLLPTGPLDGLIYPTGLPATLIPGIDAVLRRVPATQRQPLLDELQGQMRLPGKTIHNPAGWLLALSQRSESDPLPLAAQEAQARRQQQAVQKLMASAVPEPVQPKAVPVQPMSDERREWLRAERKRLGLRAPKGLRDEGGTV